SAPSFGYGGSSTRADGAEREPDSRRSTRPEPTPAAGAVALAGPAAGPEGPGDAGRADPAGAAAAQSGLGDVSRRWVVRCRLVVVWAAALQVGRLVLSR